MVSADRAANLAENPYAGQGPVLLDIGGDVGAVVLHAPADWEGAEVGYRRADAPVADPPGHHHHHDHDHDHGHEHDHGHDHGHLPHVAVTGRPAGGRVHFTAVFPELVEGAYRLSLPDGRELAVDVVGGRVTEVEAPGHPEVVAPG